MASDEPFLVGKPGVNLGGWLLLEPGPSYPLFTHHLLKDKSQVRRHALGWIIAQTGQLDSIGQLDILKHT
jgi:hypothetical protein